MQWQQAVATFDGKTHSGEGHHAGEGLNHLEADLPGTPWQPTDSQVVSHRAAVFLLEHGHQGVSVVPPPRAQGWG